MVLLPFQCYRVNKPIVWTLRDMWPLTGGCHYAVDCYRYILGCGKCPQLSSSNKFDLSRFTVFLKCKLLPPRIHVVGISHWLSKAASSSKVFTNYSVRTISNNIDTDEFSPLSREVARSILGLSNSERILLIGAQNIADFYKGLDLFLQAIPKIATPNIRLLSFGKLSNSVLANLPISHTPLGYLSDSISIRLAYAAADVFIAPSRIEAFGKTLAESLACGTPVVCFDATGPKDIVDHMSTGYKALPFDSSDLARGIDMILSLSQARYLAMRNACRERALNLFDSRVIARHYFDLYKKIII